MKDLKERIAKSGLKKKHIAKKIGIGASHLTMMLNDKATMPDDVRYRIDKLLAK